MLSITIRGCVRKGYIRIIADGSRLESNGFRSQSSVCVGGVHENENENENNKQRMKHETLKTMMMMNGQSPMVACEVVMLLQCG